MLLIGVVIMAGFETWREGDEKLWVQTPLPLTAPEWAYFVLDKFPKFKNDSNKIRTLNRNDAMKRFEIANGQIGDRTTYAFLPDDKRYDIPGLVLATSDRGVIYCPAELSDYILPMQLNLDNNKYEFLLEMQKNNPDFVETIQDCLEIISNKKDSLDKSIIFNNLVSNLKESMENKLKIKIGDGQFYSKGTNYLPSEAEFFIPYYNLNLRSYTAHRLLVGLGNSLGQPVTGNKITKSALGNALDNLVRIYQPLIK